MTTRCMIQTTMMGLLLLGGCAKKTVDDPTGAANPPTDAPASERKSLSSAECELQGGRVVGDIGDGAIHRPDYTCESGKPPLGDVRPAEGEPVAIEGSVCCPAV